MMKHFKKSIVTLIFSGTLAACAGTAERPVDDDRAALPRGTDCISQGTVRDYRVLDDANLVVTAAHQRRYHVQLAHRAHGLRSSYQIGFASTSGQICGGFDELVINDGFGSERIRIYSVRRLTPAGYDALLVRFGKKEPGPEHAPAPEEVESAEVEELD